MHSRHRPLYLALRAVLLVMVAFGTAGAQVPAQLWDNTIGGTLGELGTVAVATPDGGCVIGGYGNSGLTGDKDEAGLGSNDIWIYKVDANGALVWQEAFGSSGDDQLLGMSATTDGGFLLVGSSNGGITGDKTEASLGGFDVWVLKVDGTGNLQWEETYGSTGVDRGARGVQVSSGNYVILGQTDVATANNDVAANGFGLGEFWVFEINPATQAIVWQQRIGGNSFETARYIIATPDGGTLLVGNSFSSGISGNKTEAGNGNFDVLAVKLSSTGAISWQNTIGGPNNDEPYTIIPTTDGHYVITCSSSSGVGADKTSASFGLLDYWAFKLHSSGSPLLWQFTAGGTGNETAYSGIETPDGGFLIGGSSQSPVSGNKTTAPLGIIDYWVLKLNSAGSSILWQASFGGSSNDELRTVALASDSSYFIVGYSISNTSATKSENSQGGFDYWIVKLEAEAPLPVEALPLQAYYASDGVRLSWHVLNETNNLGFQLQRSEQHQGYENLEYVPGRGTTQQPFTYEVLDAQVHPNRIYHYRYLQLDYDGRGRPSNEVEVRLMPDGQQVRFAPNPAQAYLDVWLPAGWNSELKLLDANGRRALVVKGQGGFQRLNLASLPRGVYSLLANSPQGQPVVHRVVLH